MSNCRIVSIDELGVGFPVVDFFDSRESAELALLFLASGRHRETEPATAADLADPGHPWAIVPRTKAVL